MKDLRALVVDDSQAMRRSLVFALQRLSGLHCEEAADGAEGLKKLSHARFDLVLTDINMPLMDGLKLIHHIRQSDAHRSVPVVVITTEAAAADRSRAMALGASAYLVKPVQAHTVLETVKSLLKLP
jgi:two-component system, chemotaxis family, chemotaxis protein CheY